MSLEAITRSREMVKGEFSNDTEGGGEVTEVEWACVQAFNAHWAIKANPLGTQIWYLLIGLFKAIKYSPEELGVELELSIFGQIKEVKNKIDLIEHLKFREGITYIPADTIFNTPESESEAAPTTHKRK